MESTRGIHVSQERIKSTVKNEQYFLPDANGAMLICVLTLRNGFKVTGEASCLDPKNYSDTFQRRIAKQRALEKVAMLEAYLIKEADYQLTLL